MPAALSKPRLPAELGHFADRLRGGLSGRDVVEHIRARFREIDQLRIHRRIREIVGLLHDHLGGAAGIFQRLLERAEEIAAEIVILIENTDLGVRLHRDHVLGQDTRFGRIERKTCHGPFVILGIVPFGRAGVEQKLRHALGIEIFVHGGLRRGTQRAVEREHLVLLDQATRGFDAFRRAIGIVHGEEGDLAPVDTALVVEHLEIGFPNAAQHAIERARAAMRHGLSDLDLGVAGAEVVFLLGGESGG